MIFRQILTAIYIYCNAFKTGPEAVILSSLPVHNA